MTNDKLAAAITPAMRQRAIDLHCCFHGIEQFTPHAMPDHAVLRWVRVEAYIRGPLIDLPDQTCPACHLEHPGADCGQPDLFGETA